MPFVFCTLILELLVPSGVEEEFVGTFKAGCTLLMKDQERNVLISLVLALKWQFCVALGDGFKRGYSPTSSK